MVMRIAHLAVLAAAVFLFSGIARAQSGRVIPTPTPEEPIRVATEEVKLTILAYDDDGRFVTDVTEKDLVITENDVLHQPSSVRRMPANVLIIMDTGGELRSAKSLELTRKAAFSVVSALKADDSVAILQYSDKAEMVGGWTANRDETAAAIGRTKFGRRSAFTGALKLAYKFLSTSGRENKHVVLISDGTDSEDGPLAKQRAMRALLSSDITVHVLSYTRMEADNIESRARTVSNTAPPEAVPAEVAATLPNGARDVAQAPKIGPTINLDRKHLRTIKARKSDLESSELQLTELANNANGTLIIPLDREEMLEKGSHIARLIDASYVVTYSPKIPLSEGRGDRNILVTSKRAGLTVEARRKLVVGDGRR
jgi:Mg-chelatase subunit ChlD